ncbi:MAG: TRAP transporter substrate-binding protein [Alphaproteobacteria bacterium]
MNMNRRTFVAAAATTLAAPAIVQAQTRKLKLSHYLPPVHQVHAEFVRWTDELREKTGGLLDIEVFPAGQMGPPPRQFDLARTGVADLSFVFTALVPGRFPLTDATSLPFLFADDQAKPISTADASYIGTAIRDHTTEEFAGTQLLYAVVSTALGFFMRDKLIETPDDLKGLRVRPTSAAVADQLTALGASPATIPPTELADAIDKGVVDGAIFNFEGGKVFQLHQAVGKVSTLACATGYFCLVINADTMSGLPDEAKQAILETTGPEAGRRVGGLYDAAEVAGRAFMEGEGVEILDLVGDAAQPFREALDPVRQAQIEALRGAGKDVDGLIAAITEMKASL